MSPLKDGRIPWDLSQPGILGIWMEHLENMAYCAAEQKLVLVFGADWNCNGVWMEAGSKEWDLSHVQRPWAHQVEKATSLLAVRRQELGMT